MRAGISLGQPYGAARGDTPIVVGKNSERWGFIRSGNTLIWDSEKPLPQIANLLGRTDSIMKTGGFPITRISPCLRTFIESLLDGPDGDLIINELFASDEGLAMSAGLASTATPGGRLRPQPSPEGGIVMNTTEPVVGKRRPASLKPGLTRVSTGFGSWARS
jgi:hypothetical protein